MFNPDFTNILELKTPPKNNIQYIKFFNLFSSEREIINNIKKSSVNYSTNLNQNFQSFNNFKTVENYSTVNNKNYYESYNKTSLNQFKNTIKGINPSSKTSPKDRKDSFNQVFNTEYNTLKNINKCITEESYNDNNPKVQSIENKNYYKKNIISKSPVNKKLINQNNKNNNAQYRVGSAPKNEINSKYRMSFQQKSDDSNKNKDGPSFNVSKTNNNSSKIILFYYRIY